MIKSPFVAFIVTLPFLSVCLFICNSGNETVTSGIGFCVKESFMKIWSFMGKRFVSFSAFIFVTKNNFVINNMVIYKFLFFKKSCDNISCANLLNNTKNLINFSGKEILSGHFCIFSKIFFIRFEIKERAFFCVFNEVYLQI